MLGLNKSLLVFLITLCAACKPPVPTDPVALSAQYAPLESTPSPKGTNVSLGLAGYAKVMCSAVFVTGRNIDEALHNSGYFFLPDEFYGKVGHVVDWEKKSVTLSLGDTLYRTARLTSGQGCIIQTEQKLYFEPIEIQSTLTEASAMPWPMGDLIIGEGENFDPTLMQAATDTAFAPDALTAAFLVIHNGKIVAERYAEGIDQDTQLESWSMGKSLTATLIGRMIQEGYLTIDGKAPVAAWQEEGDPRKEIRIKDLLQMSSGLWFQSHRDPDAKPAINLMDHFYIYSGAVDAFNYSYDRPLEFPIGTKGQYHNCDPLILGYIMQTVLSKNGIEYLTYPQQHLFDKIGIRKQVMETDPYGNYLLTGFDYGTARNWGRLGMLYLQNGSWNGEQILPPSYTSFVSTAAPAWEDPVYGGLFWINGNGEMPIPKEAYYMAGAGGQRTIIIPSKGLVVVRLGHHRGDEIGMKSLNSALAKLMEAF